MRNGSYSDSNHIPDSKEGSLFHPLISYYSENPGSSSYFYCYRFATILSSLITLSSVRLNLGIRENQEGLRPGFSGNYLKLKTSDFQL